MRHTAALLVLCLSLLLAACGWHLRAPVTYSNLPTLALSGGSSALLYPLRRSLTQSGVTVTTTAPITLHIVSERWSDRTVAVDSNGRQAAIELTYILSWQLYRDDKPITEVRTIRLASNVNQNPINATAASDELNFNKKVMRRDAIQQLERQLQNVSSKMDLSKPQPQPETGKHAAQD